MTLICEGSFPVLLQFNGVLLYRPTVGALTFIPRPPAVELLNSRQDGIEDEGVSGGDAVRSAPPGAPM